MQKTVMKKLVLLALILTGALTAQADDYPYLTFEMTDGTKASVAVKSLTLTISGTTLTLGSQTFTLLNLSKMYFSATDETATGTDIVDNLTIDDLLLDNAEIYDLNGRKIARKASNSKLPRGVYIVKTKERTCKIVVK